MPSEEEARIIAELDAAEGDDPAANGEDVEQLVRTKIVQARLREPGAGGKEAWENRLQDSWRGKDGGAEVRRRAELL